MAEALAIPEGSSSELVSKGYVIRRDQAERIERYLEGRPGASRSDIVRDLLDAGFGEYERQRAMLAHMKRASA